MGRLFIYKISLRIYKDNWLYGIGIGKLKVVYGLYQAKYFASELYTKKEFLLADNTYYTFNDYWQFIIETGFLGISLISIFIFLFYFLIKKLLLELSSSPYINILIQQTIAFLIAPCFTHLFDHKFFVIIVLLFLSALIGTAFRSSKFIRFFTIVLLMWSCFTYYKSYKKNKALDEAKMLSNIGYRNESLKLYSLLYSEFKTDIDFILLYSDELYYSNDSKLGISILSDLLKKRTNNLLYKKLADLYLKEHDYINAEINYKMAVNIVPNRFLTRYALFNFYNATGRIEKAKAVAHFLLNMPVKIPSYQIIELKQAVVHKLKE